MNSSRHLRIIWLLVLALIAVHGVHNAAPVQKTGADSAPPSERPRLVVQLGHSLPVRHVAFSPDGRYVLTGSKDDTAILWDVTTGREIRRFTEHSKPGHSSAGTCVAFSTDGRLIFTGSEIAHVWDAVSGKEISRFESGFGKVEAAAFSPDGQFVWTGDGFGSARLWEATSGKELRQMKTSPSLASSIAFSPGGQFVFVSESNEGSHLWDTATGRQVQKFQGPSDGVQAAVFSRDGRLLLTGGFDRTAILWDVATGKILNRFYGHSSPIESVDISSDGRFALTGSYDKTTIVWDAVTGKELQRLQQHSAPVHCVAFSPVGQYVFTASEDNTASLWNLATGAEAHRFEGRPFMVFPVAFSTDGQYILTGSFAGTGHIWDLAAGKQAQRIPSQPEPRSGILFSADGRIILKVDRRKNASLWDTATGREIRRFPLLRASDLNLSAQQVDSATSHSRQVEQDLLALISIAISPDERFILTGGSDGAAILWDAMTGKEIRRFQGPAGEINAVAFSPDGKLILTAGRDRTARLWDTATGKEMRKFEGHSSRIWSASFSADGQLVLTGSKDRTARLWEAATGKEVRKFQGHVDDLVAAAISRDGQFVLTSGGDNTVRLWEAATGREVRQLEGHAGFVTSVAFSPDGRFLLTGSLDGTARLWSSSTGRQLCQMVSFRDGTWAVIDSEGRYDASNGGDVEGLHWASGNETIALSQLKERYYDPGMLAKIVGLNKEPLRDVSIFSGAKLFPLVEYNAPPAGNRLKIKLTNRGGGIGRVRVLVNDKEVIADARPANLNPHATKIDLTVDLPRALIKPGEQNRIQVLAWNAEDYLSSRGAELVWTPPGEAVSEKPEMYAIVGGVSTYSSEAINLRYAAKDAEDMALALRLGAKRLFGAEKVHMTVLSTSGNPGTLPPTKVSFRKAFEAARKAKPGDIFVIYLAGHGVALKLPESKDGYAFLTKEARSTDLNDPEIRKQSAITSEELVEWIKQVPALKQVMILDTCAAGAAAARLVENRNVPGDQVRAIERLKDRTGFHVLMGSAADKVSYETSQFSQGLLTYALLEGMKGAALLREEFIDVSKLFQYAADRVPDLARSIRVGGIQRPLIAAPRGGASFEVGQLKREDKEAIGLTAALPLILRPVFVNADQGFDDLELMAAVRRRLDEESFTVLRGEAKIPSVVYVDAEELPAALRPSGVYRVEGEIVRVTVNLIRDKQRVSSFEVEGRRDDTAGLAVKIVERIGEMIKELR